MPQENETQTLVDLGLTDLQAKVYLALATSGRTSAKTITNLSNVARQETYRILNELIELGLVHKIISTPTKFEPLPLSDCISLMLEKRIKKTDELRSKTREFLRKHNLDEDHKEPLDAGYQFIEIPQKWAIDLKQKQTWKNIQTCDMIASLKKFKPWIFLWGEEIMKALNKGAKIRFIMDKPERNSPVIDSINAFRKKPSFTIRFVLKQPLAQLAIIDNKEAFLSTAPSTSTIPPLLSSNHPSFVHLAQQYFELMWFTALEDEHQEDVNKLEKDKTSRNSRTKKSSEISSSCSS